MKVIEALPDSDKDDVVLNMVKCATDNVIVRFAKDPAGSRMLSYLYEELTAGSMGDMEAIQANRILMAKSYQIGPQRYEKAAENAKVFPYRLPGLTVVHDAPVLAQRRKGGMIWVRQPTRVYVTDEFRPEIATLPPAVFSVGIEIPETEIIGVKMYDLGGIVHYRPALYLLQLANETISTVYQKWGEIAALGISMGTAGLAGAGTRGTATFAMRALKLMDHAASILGTVSTVLNEHRGWILSRFGDEGKEFLRYVDLVNSAMTIFSGGRALFQMGKLVNGLRKSYGRWRKVAASAEESLSPSEQKAMKQIHEMTDDFFEKVDDARGGGKPRSTKELETRPIKGEEVWDELTEELDLTRGGSRATAGTRSEVVHAVEEAQKAGLMKGIEPDDVALAVQEHTHAPTVRKTLGVSGKEVESAHVGATSFLKDVKGYKRGKALTVLLPKEVHSALDNQWKTWAKNLRREGRTEVTALELYKQMEEAIENTPGLRRDTKHALMWKMYDEMFRELGLKLDENIPLPYANIRPAP